MTEILAGALFMFILKETSRNAYNNDRRESVFRKNFLRCFRFKLPQADAVDQVIRDLEPQQLEVLKSDLVSSLIEQRLMRKYRFMGKRYLIAVDATGMATFQHRHCDQCLTKTSKNGVVRYFHYVLEAKLVTSSGLAISLASEFIENPASKEYEKQDCEQKAFRRLSVKIKKHFPRLPICLLADGLYPNNTVFSICEKYGWQFIITLKDDCLKTFNEEVQLLRATTLKREVYRANKTSRTTLQYQCLNNIEYDKRHFSWVECVEDIVYADDRPPTRQRFTYITNVRQTRENLVTTADSGRLRWRIENEGFNAQKNLGYGLEHKFSRVSYPAMQNYYQVLQIAHMINQLVECSKEVAALMAEHSKQTIVDLWKKLLSYLTMIAHQTTAAEHSDTG